MHNIRETQQKIAATIANDVKGGVSLVAEKCIHVLARGKGTGHAGKGRFDEVFTFATPSL